MENLITIKTGMPKTREGSLCLTCILNISAEREKYLDEIREELFILPDFEIMFKTLQEAAHNLNEMAYLIYMLGSFSGAAETERRIYESFLFTK